MTKSLGTYVAGFLTIEIFSATVIADGLTDAFQGLHTLDIGVSHSCSRDSERYRKDDTEDTEQKRETSHLNVCERWEVGWWEDGTKVVQVVQLGIERLRQQVST